MRGNQLRKTNDNGNMNQYNKRLDDNANDNGGDGLEYAYRSDQKPQQEFSTSKNLLNAQQQSSYQQQKNQYNQSPQQQWMNQDNQARKPQYGSQQQPQYQQQYNRQQQQQQQQYFSQQHPRGEDGMSEGGDGDPQNQLEHTFSEDSMADNQSQVSLKASNVPPTFAQSYPKPSSSDKKVLAIITLDVDEGKSGEIKVCEGDVLTDLAREFCAKHQLDDDCIEFIASQCQNHLDARKKQRKIKQTSKQGIQNESKSGESPKFPMNQQTQNGKNNKSLQHQQQQTVGSFKYAQQQQQPALHQQGFPGRSKNIAEQKIVEEDYEDQSLSLAGQSANASLPEEHYQPYPPQQIQTINHTNRSSRSSTGRPQQQQRREGESEERKKQLMNEILLDDNDDGDGGNGFDGNNRVDLEEQQFSTLNREQQQQRNNIQNLPFGQSQQFQEKKQSVQGNLRAKEEGENDDEGASRRKQILSQVSQKLKQEDIKNNQINRNAVATGSITAPTRVAQQSEKQNTNHKQQTQMNQLQQQQQQIQLQQQGRHHQQIQQKSNTQLQQQQQQQQQQQAYQAPQPRFKGGNLKEQLEAKKQQFFNSYQAEHVPTLPTKDDYNSKELKELDNQMRKSKSNNNIQPAPQADKLDGRSDKKSLQGQQQPGLQIKQPAAKPGSTTAASSNSQNSQAIRYNASNNPASEQNPSALVKNKSASMLNPSNSRQNTNPSSHANNNALPSSPFDKLYLQGLDQMEKKKRIYEENQAKVRQKEIAGVTFQPSISPQSRSLKLSEGVKVEDYLLLEGKKLKERKAIAVLIKSEENSQQCTFKPEISLVSQKLAEHMQQEQEQHIVGLSSSASPQQSQQQSSQQYSSIHERLYRQGEADKINKEQWSNQQFGQIYPFSPDIGVNSRNRNTNTTDSATQKEFVNRLVDERLLKERSTFNKQLDKEHFDLETGQPLYQPRINKDKVYQKVSARIDLQDQLLGEELRCRSVSPANASNNCEGRKITPHRIRMLPWDELLRDKRQPWEYDVSRGQQVSSQSSQQSSSQLSKKSRCTTPKGCSSKGVNSDRFGQDSGYVPLNKRGVSQNLNPQQEIEDIIAQFQRNHSNNNNNNDANTKTIIMKSQTGHEDLTPVVKLQKFPQRQLSANISSNEDKNNTMLQQTQGLTNSYVTTTPRQAQPQQQIGNTSSISGGYRSKSQINLQDQTTTNNNHNTTRNNNQTMSMVGIIPEKLNHTQMELSAISQLDNSRIFNDQKLSEKIDILFSQFDSDNDGKISSLSIDISNTDPDILQIIQHVLYEIDEKNLTLSKSQFAHFLASNQLLLPLKRYFAEKEGDLCDEDLTDYNVIRANNSYLNQTLENQSKINNNNINASNFSGYKNPNSINNSNINKYPQDSILQRQQQVPQESLRNQTNS